MTHILSDSERIAHCTVRIEIETAQGDRGTGTGFFYQFVGDGNKPIPAIVTNKHVIADGVSGKFLVTLASPDGNPDYNSQMPFNFDNFQQRWILHPDPDIDLCAMPIVPLLKAAQQQGKRLFKTSVDRGLIPTDADLADMTAVEDVIMAGYPKGIWDQKHNMPVLRRGITATHPNLDWNGKPEFLIDAACFPGSSGSPVFLFNIAAYHTKSGGTRLAPGRIKLLGILYAGPVHEVPGEIKIVPVPTADKPIAVSKIPI